MDKLIAVYNKLREVVEDKGYIFYSKPYDLNIIGIRSEKPIVNQFCDLICVAYTNNNCIRKVHIMRATTDPGLYWLNNPMNVNGTAIVKEGNYKSLWTTGLHKGYQALVQANNITVYRDNDRDSELDIIKGTEETGLFGIDLHHAAMDGTSNIVDKWSAGCQVVSDDRCDFPMFMALVDTQIKYGHGKYFSYSLINEKDLE